MHCALEPTIYRCVALCDVVPCMAWKLWSLSLTRTHPTFLPLSPWYPKGTCLWAIHSYNGYPASL